jgi:hypothetical protein
MVHVERAGNVFTGTLALVKRLMVSSRVKTITSVTIYADGFPQDVTAITLILNLMLLCVLGNAMATRRQSGNRRSRPRHCGLRRPHDGSSSIAARASIAAWESCGLRRPQPAASAAGVPFEARR